MFSKKEISFHQSKSLNKLVQDYLEGNENTKSLYHHFPDKNGFEKIIQHNKYQNFDRENLVQILLKQNSNIENFSDASAVKLQSLKNKNTFTVTTGHQLCLLTGPLYFVYKILTTINLAEELSKLFPEHNFVPVYWLASEDHDFEEINHIHLFGKKLVWNTDQTGAVGNFETNDLSEFFEQLKVILGDSENAKQIISFFEKSYFRHKNLADATKFLVNHLFGKYGLLCVDGNDKEFKKQFISFFKEDIFENKTNKLVSQTNTFLEENKYSVQVNAREINCFLLDENSRNRIEREGENFKVIGTDKLFSKNEMIDLIENHSEKISPNVVLRPNYQQTILPNIAYVGGPGELAYWLQFKGMFDALDVQFPILTPRNFLTVVDSTTKNKISKLKLSGEDFFNSEVEIIQKFQSKNNSNFELIASKENIKKLFETVHSEITQVDKSLVSAVEAELQKALNGLNVLESKANKAIKQKFETEINQIKNCKQKLFPEAIPQERFENIFQYILKYGFEYIQVLKDAIMAFHLNHKILIEEN